MRYRVLILTAFVLLASASGASAARRRTPPLVLHARSQHAVYNTGANVQLNFSLTNRTGKAIRLANLSTGTIVIDSVRRTAAKPRARPVRLRPTVSQIFYDDGLPYALLSSLRRVSARSTLRFGESSGPYPPGVGLYSIGFDANQDTLASMYPLAVAGRYRVTLHYRFPARAPHEPWYGGSSSEATVTFRVRKTHTAPGSVVTLADFRRSSPTSTNGPTAAAASIKLATDATTEFRTAVHNCVNQFAAPGRDPDNLIPNVVLDKSVHVFIKETNASRNSTVAYPPGNPSRPDDVSVASGGTGRGTGALIDWNPTNTAKYAGTDVARDPCSSLYHELFHAYQIAHGTIDNRKYDGSKLPTREVMGVRAENDERKAKGLPLRTDYDGFPIPLPLTTPPPTPPVSSGEPAGYPCSGEPVNNNQPCFLALEVDGDEPGPDEEYGDGVVTVAPGTGEPTIAQSSSPEGGFASGSWAAQYNTDPGCYDGDQEVGECYQLSWSSPQTITLTAHAVPDDGFGNNSPDYDSEFLGWGGDCASAGTAPTCTLAIGQVKGASGTYSLSVVAYFEATDSGAG